MAQLKLSNDRYKKTSPFHNILLLLNDGGTVNILENQKILRHMEKSVEK
jgi:hypothetical protein